VWRNTSPIFDAVMAFYEGSKVACRGPDGPQIEVLSVTRDTMKAELSKVLHRLITEGDLRPRDVAVLTPHAADHSALRGKVGSFQLVSEPSAKKDILLASIYRYKGLDAPAVVLCDIDRYVEEDFKKLMYVDCSRIRAVVPTEGPRFHFVREPLQAPRLTASATVRWSRLAVDRRATTCVSRTRSAGVSPPSIRASNQLMAVSPKLRACTCRLVIGGCA
jgi:hypothetical protein